MRNFPRFDFVRRLLSLAEFGYALVQPRTGLGKLLTRVVAPEEQNACARKMGGR